MNVPSGSLLCQADSGQRESLAVGVAVTVLYLGKHGQRFKHLEAVLCARKTFVSYWFIVSCSSMDGRALLDS